MRIHYIRMCTLPRSSPFNSAPACLPAPESVHCVVGSSLQAEPLRPASSWRERLSRSVLPKLLLTGGKASERPFHCTTLHSYSCSNTIVLNSVVPVFSCNQAPPLHPCGERSRLPRSMRNAVNLNRAPRRCHQFARSCGGRCSLAHPFRCSQSIPSPDSFLIAGMAGGQSPCRSCDLQQGEQQRRPVVALAAARGRKRVSDEVASSLAALSGRQPLEAAAAADMRKR